MKKLAFVVVVLVAVFWTCINPPNYPDEPVLEFKNLSKATLRQGLGTFDTTWVTLGFTDGDGDLGDADSLSVFVIDQRDQFLKAKFRLPFVPEEGAGNGISGEIRLRLNTSCCIYPGNVQLPCTASTDYPRDTLIYEIYIKDRAGNESNRVQTSVITLLCL